MSAVQKPVIGLVVASVVVALFFSVSDRTQIFDLKTVVELPPRVTVGGCVNRSFPLQNGGFVRHNESHIIILAVKGTDVQQLHENMTCLRREVVHIVIEVRVDPEMWSSFDEQQITAVTWSKMAVVPYHSLYLPGGIFGQHAILTDFAARRGIRDAQLRTHLVDPLKYGRQLPPMSTVFYKLLFLGTYPTTGMRDGDALWNSGTLIFMPNAVMKRQFWSLPMDNTISLLRKSLYERFGTPQAASNRYLLLEPRQYSHHPNRRQFRGYRPQVMNAILSMTRANNLSLDKPNFKALTFRQQWNVVTSHTRMIVSEGSFSVWVPFLRKDAVCLMIYDHYGTGWHIPHVHLPVALLGTNQNIKMVFVSIESSSAPSSAFFETELFQNVAPQVRVVTVPSNVTFAARLLTEGGGKNTSRFTLENGGAVFRG
ncbi:transmembrane protein, putative [Bodo saltans]|uniref:Transmembrane protein, putative n=1 Tax=Bodo saltans TaxID=75058 RepID=A0A0S4JDP0_BODSA|nr:transmembrane protein, putative [Bodo saltans]|eukprot:CUG86466.1 transmembrane protein, putative [Bodo saltans]